MTHLTVRNVPAELTEALMAEKTRRDRAHFRRPLCPHRSRRVGDSVTNAVVVVTAG